MHDVLVAQILDTTDDLTDSELLASALAEALVARAAGVLGGPGVNEVALAAAQRRAARADARRTVTGAAGADVASLVGVA